MTAQTAGPRQTVAVLGSYAPSLINFRSTLIQALVKRGYQVVAMAPDADAKIIEQLAAIGADFRQVPLSGHSLSPISMLKTIVALRRLFSEIRPAAIIAYTIKPVTLGALAAAAAGVPKFVSMVTGLGYAFGDGAGARRRLARAGATTLYRAAMRRSSVVVFQNPDDESFMRINNILPANANSIVVGGSGIDLEQFDQRPLAETPRFLMVSRLIGDKGVREYGNAAMALKARHPHALFRLVGFFDQSPDALTEAEVRAMEGAGMEFLGRRDDVRPALADATIFVLPSYFREGTPRSILEALAMGRPVITTDQPGCRETVADGVNGFLIPPRDVEALEGAMEKFILDPALIAEMGVRSRELAERKYDVHSVNKQIFAAAGL